MIQSTFRAKGGALRANFETRKRSTDTRQCKQYELDPNDPVDAELIALKKAHKMKRDKGDFSPVEITGGRK